MYEDVLRFWISLHNNNNNNNSSSSSSPHPHPEASTKVVEALMSYGPSHPELYPLVLRFLTSSRGLLEKHEEDVKGMLGVIDEEGIVAPLGVVGILSRGGVVGVGLVKDWLVGRIKEGRGEIQSVRLSFLFPFFIAPFSFPFPFCCFSHRKLIRECCCRTKNSRARTDLRQRPSSSS